MCPGGTIVAATNHAGRVVVNGMSYSARRAALANSAVVVEVPVTDYEAGDPLAGARYQDAIAIRGPLALDAEELTASIDDEVVPAALA